MSSEETPTKGTLPEEAASPDGGYAPVGALDGSGKGGEKEGAPSTPSATSAFYESDEEADRLRKFLLTPAAKERNSPMQYYIIRNKKGPKGNMFPVYELYDEANPQKPEFCCAVKRRVGSKASNYTCSLSKRSFEKDVMFLGKCRGNLHGTEYMLWEGDVTRQETAEDEEKMLKNEIGCAIYLKQAKLSFLSKVPRKMTLLLPRRELGPDGKEIAYRHKEKSSKLAASYKLIQETEAKTGGALQAQNAPLVLVNKEPVFNEKAKRYVLDFRGRVKQASVKNFQLVTKDDVDTVILQFGKVDSNKFNMDFRYPLSPLQAFLACITTFDKPAN